MRILIKLNEAEVESIVSWPKENIRMHRVGTYEGFKEVIFRIKCPKWRRGYISSRFWDVHLHQDMYLRFACVFLALTVLSR